MTEMEIRKQFIDLRDELIRNYFKHLNKDQLNAVLSDNDAVLTAACPGAGKTQVIVNRIVYLTLFGKIYKSKNVPKNINEKDLKEIIDCKNLKSDKIPCCIHQNFVPQEQVVVITFTKMAARNMRERYIKISGSKTTPFFGTFHSLFYRIMRSFDGKFSIMNENQGYGVIKEILENYLDSINEDEIKMILNDISNYKNKKLLSIEYKTKTDRAVFDECLKAYENFRLKNNLMDFDDIIINCIKLFENNKDILNIYREKFKHILVDEFQDCDSEQIYMLQLLAKGNSIFAVGDEDQCIYGFRGSRPDCMVDFQKYFKSGVKYFLNKNYRSGRHIIEISQTLICNNKLRHEKEMQGVKMEPGKIAFLNFKTEKEQADKVIELILELKNKNQFKLNDTAVLYRTNNEAQKIISALIKNKIRFTLTDKKYNFFNLDICRDIISYLRLSQDAYNRESFIRVINKPCRYISKIKIEKINSSRFSKNWFEFLMELPDMTLLQIKEVYKFKRHIRKLAGLSTEKALDYILNRIGYKNNIKNHSQDILNELRDICSDFKTIPEFLNYTDSYKNGLKAEAIGDEMVLSTIHSVKGLEYKNVFIINCNGDNMPHLNSLSSIEEERRLFYVGITRAAENLWISYSETFKGNPCEISPFIKECNSKS